MNGKGSLWILFVLSLLFLNCSKEHKNSAPEPAQSESAPPAGQPASIEGTGTLTGKIIFKGAYNPGALSVGKDREVCGTSKSDPALDRKSVV